MRRAATLVIALSVLAFGATASAERSMDEPVAPARTRAVPGPGVILTSNGTTSGLAARETAGPDTFALYGGPDDLTEGKFQLSDGVTPDWGDGSGLPGGYGGGPEAWTPVDLTDLPVFWHVSTFNSENLNDNGAGNHAMWCGIEAGDPFGASWEHLPGYGNNWRDVLVYESSPVADPSAGQTVQLDFFYNHDTEPGFDFFMVEYDSAGYWTQVLAADGSNKDTSNLFQAPGEQFSLNATGAIAFSPNSYGGDAADQIVIRMVVETDGAWSDEDGLWPTDGGAAQVDDISLTTSQGTFFEDYEGAGPYLFKPDKAPIAGDFADIYPLMTDTDPCRSALTPVIGFMDYGQIVRNGPGTTGETSTGGSTSAGVAYGIPGNYVFNYNGGLSFGAVNMTNEIWSPVIQWDLPGSDDDGADVAGAFYRFSVWNDLPVLNGIFFTWHVRSAAPGEDFTNWSDRNFVYHGGSFGFWSNQLFDVSDLLVPGPERVQLALGGWDFASIFGFPGTAARPSPVFDNVALYKYRVGGPIFASRNIDLAQDGFPVSGSIDASTQAGRDALDVPFSMARDVNNGDTQIVPGDSIVVDVVGAIPSTTVTDIRMVWALNTNPVFEDAIRSAPARTKDENVVAGAAGSIWTGEVVADSARTFSGSVVDNRFFVDLPDADFMYPGDVLHYYIEATDSDGRVSTFPSNTTEFGDFSQGSLYSRVFTVRALPSITDVVGAQPELLVINDFGHRGGEDEFTTSFQQLGYHEGVDYDTYTVMGPSSEVGNGIGSSGAHGANGDQLAGYHHIFYFVGNLSSGLLSNGDNSGWNEKGDDIGTLEDWAAIPGVRNGAYFGDYIASGMVGDSAEALNYLTSTLGVNYQDIDVRDAIGGQTTPRVVPTPYGATWFTNEYAVYGGCLGINEFDQILPQAGAEGGHYFADPDGQPYDDPFGSVASVIHPVANGINITFPYSMTVIQGLASRAVNFSARTLLFEDVLGLFNAGINHSPAVGAPKAQLAALSTFPNPFNPVTTVKFTAQLGSRGSVRVYNLRGELVRTLHSGEFTTQEFRWNGVDSRGARVGSGVYLIRATDGTVTQTQKVALVK